MAQGYSLHPDGTLAEHTVTNTRAYTEIHGLDDGRTVRDRLARRRAQLHSRGTALLPHRSASAPIHTARR